MRYFVDVGGGSVELDVQRNGDGTYLMRDSTGRELHVESAASDAFAHTLLVDGHVIEAHLPSSELKLGSNRYLVHVESERERAAGRARPRELQALKDIRAPMPGRIVRVSCEAGSHVSKGAALVVIEAMKMQNELCAKADYVIRKVYVAAGDTVERGAVLIEFE